MPIINKVLSIKLKYFEQFLVSNQILLQGNLLCCPTGILMKIGTHTKIQPVKRRD